MEVKNMKLSLKIDDCSIVKCTITREDNAQYTLRPQSPKLCQAGNWKVCIKDNPRLTDGKIHVTYRGNLPIKNRSFKIRDGNIVIDESSEQPITFNSTKPLTMLYRRFGITSIVHADPNRIVENSWHLDNDPEEYCVFCAASDGQKIAIRDHQLVPTNLHKHIGTIRYEITDSTWLITCLIGRYHRSIEKIITLYTRVPNLFYLAKNLEKYLDQNNYRLFEDLAEQYIIR